MKTYYWFSRNHSLSHLRFASAHTFITARSRVPTPLNSSPPWRGLIVPLVLVWFGLSSATQAVVTDPQGYFPGNNTAEGQFALFSRISGLYNTAVGWKSLYTLNSGSYNTGFGAATLIFNTGDDNTAVGSAALFGNTTGGNNTATGFQALLSNNIGSDNTANGWQALFNNTSGNHNTADGEFALFHNVHGSGNTALGLQALFHNNFGDDNTAVGVGALLNSATGSNNIGLGQSAGYGVTTASNVICIGYLVPGANVPNSCYIGNIWGQTPGFPDSPVYVDSNGKLGTNASAERFKKNIKPMDSASEAILALKPVTFHYKSDSNNTPQFGLIAEEVAEVNPDLVVRDKNGEIYSVRYDQVNAMLLNEFLKEHKRVQELNSTVAKQEAAIVQQRKNFAAAIVQQQNEIASLTATVKEQVAQIQKVSARLELRKSAPQTVLNHQ